jgi:hypothetical protein
VRLIIACSPGVLTIVNTSKARGLASLLQRGGEMAQERRLRESCVGRPIWIEGEKMNSDTPVTDKAFEAFLRCETKTYLLQEGIDRQSKFGSLDEGLSQHFKQSVAEWLRSSFGDDEVYVGTPSQRILKQGSHTIVLRPLIKSADLCTEPDALWRIPPVSGTRSFRYSPVRFVRNEKVSRFDKLILAFDAFALSRTLGNPAR